jgi:hypothetical protein
LEVFKDLAIMLLRIKKWYYYLIKLMFLNQN